ncbi:MAG: hypothetical protein LQ338_005874 [Usnochroma carphineum]|nr:MAG: hypothetical protein LQ338_005874 [Usnochroma carphineum]
MAASQQQLLPPPTEIDDIHKVYSIAAWCIALGLVAGICVLWRLWVRTSTRSFGADDYAIIPALLLYVGWTAMSAYVNLHAGVGKPLWEITIGEFSVWFKGIIGSAWLYPAMSVSIRISVLFFYQRIFSTPQSRIKYVIWLLLALQAVYLIVYSVLPVFICRPLYKAWHPLERQQYFNDWYYYYLQVALYSTSMTFDVILLVFPIYPVFKLQMPLKKRLGVAIMFMLGAAASIVAAYKLAIFVVEMRRYTDINPKWLRYEMSRLVPPQFDTYGRTFWIPSQVEPTVALIGTSLPAIRQSLTSAAQRVRYVWSSCNLSIRPPLWRHSHVESDRVTKRSARRTDSSDSEVKLHTEYYEMNNRGKDLGSMA